MASTKSPKKTTTGERTRKGTTSRSTSILRNSLLLLLPIVALVAALARGLESQTGEVPDWTPPAADAGH
jgi:hypothetical protein